MSNSFSPRANLDLLESKYEIWKHDSASVEPAWQMFFEGFEIGLARSSTAPDAAGAASVTTGLSEEVLGLARSIEP